MMNSNIQNPGGRHEPPVIETDSLKNEIRHHILFTLGNDPDKNDMYSIYMGLACCVRDRLLARWVNTQRALYDTLSKRVYFLSLEFLPGRFLKNYLISLNMEQEARRTLQEMDIDLDELEEEEWDAGLGNTPHPDERQVGYVSERLEGWFDDPAFYAYGSLHFQAVRAATAVLGLDRDNRGLVVGGRALSLLAVVLAIALGPAALDNVWFRISVNVTRFALKAVVLTLAILLLITSSIVW